MAPANPLPISSLASSRRAVAEEEVGLLIGSQSQDNDNDIPHHHQSSIPSLTSPSSSTANSSRNANHVTFKVSHGRKPSIPTTHSATHSNGIPLSGLRESVSGSSLGIRNALADVDGGDAADVLTLLARPKSSLRAAMSNMANSIIGAGIIGQPYALRQAGLLTGTILLVALTVTVDWTIRLIVINSKLAGRDSFQGTVEYCFGGWGLLAISSSQLAFAFGGMVAFCIIVGDSIPRVLMAIFPGLASMPLLGFLANRRVVIFLLTMGVSWPLSLYRDIAKLAKASTLALISMIVILFTVVTQSFTIDPSTRPPMTLPLWTLNSGFFQAIGVISFAFVCHHNSLLIYGSLRTPTLDRFSLVTHVSTGVSLLACLMMAFAGFLTFGSATQGNVLNNFPTDNTLVNIARACFGLNMLTTLPLEAFVCREVIFHYWYGDGTVRVSDRIHIGLTTALVVISMSISLMVCDLGAVFELIGATSACALAYILPPMCYIKLSRPSWKTRAAQVCVVFGFVVMAISVIQAVMGILSGGKEGAQCQ